MQPFVPQPVFSAEEIASLQAKITAAVNEALDKHFGPLPPLQQQQATQQATQATQHSIPPTPQAKKEEVKETRPQPIYQATIEDTEETIAESTTGSKSPNSKQLSRKWAPHTGFLTTFLATPITSLFGFCFASFLTSFFSSTLLLASQLGYIRYIEEIEASGKG